MLFSLLQEIMYHIINFTDYNEVELVPAMWVNGGVCHWPPYKGEAFQRAVRNSQAPENNWQVYNARVLYTGSYQDARKRLPLAEQQTDLQSEAEVEEKGRKRKVKRNRHYEPSESEEDVALQKRLPKPPPIMRRFIITPPSEELRFTEIPTGIPTHHEPTNLATLGSSMRQAMDAVVDAGPSLSPIRDVSPAPETPRQLLRTTPSVSGQLSGSLLHDVLVNQQILVQQNQQLTKVVQDLHAAFPAFVASQSRPHQSRQGAVLQTNILPLKGPSELLQLERDLASEAGFGKLTYTISLGLAGGGNLRETVWRALQRTFTNAFSRKVNWTGAHGKVAFQSMLLKSIVIDAVRRNPLCTTESEALIESTIKKWAGDRDGGRKKRICSAPLQLAYQPPSPPALEPLTIPSLNPPGLPDLSTLPALPPLL
ncbi:hypothetical protein ACEWY4_027361 [Coilia grayii]|uniref:DUF4806 domain-containing protein n=1 Tax=Coilia grayii TaxID=363190 RepID=A0ABD1IS68_9TELE